MYTDHQNIINIPVRIVSPGSFSGEFFSMELANTMQGNFGLILPRLSSDFFILAIRFSAVISLTGGACSHLATILREVGIPAAVLLNNISLPKKFEASFSTDSKFIKCTF